MVDPFVSQNLINRWSLARVVVQNFSHDVPCIISDGHVLWEVVRVHTDPLVSGLDVGSLKRRLADNERVDDNS